MPHFIFEDSKKINRNAYYVIENDGNSYLKVVVAFSVSNKGQVISAYLTDSIKKGEKIIWKRSNG